MATIGQYLSLITNAVYGEEVRSSIVNAIQQCYTDATDVVKVSETEPTSENTRIWIKPTTDECKVPTWEEHEALDNELNDLKGAFTTLSFANVPSMINGRLDATTGEPIEVGTSPRWITDDFFQAKYIKSLENNTTNGTTYIFYYTYEDGNYTFNEYVGTTPGTTTLIDSSKGSHIKIYSTHASSGRNVVLNQYVETFRDIQIAGEENAKVLSELDANSIVYRKIAVENDQHLLSYFTDVGVYVTRSSQTWNDSPTSNLISIINIKISNNYTFQIVLDVVTGIQYTRLINGNSPVTGWLENEYAGNADRKSILLRNQDNVRYYQGYSRTASNYSGGNIIRIAHITDTHSDSTAWGNFLYYLDNITPSVEAIVHSGDIVKTHMNHDYSYMMNNLPNDIPTIIAIGNHETGNSLEVGSGGATNSTCKGVFISPLGTKYGSSFVIPPDSDACYYYVDLKSPSNNKTLRIVTLNCYDYDTLTDGHFVNRAKMHFSKKQIDWFIDVLQDASSKSIPVCIVAHESDAFLSAFDGLINPFNMDYTTSSSQESYSYSKQWSGSPICDIIEAFIDGDGSPLNRTYDENEFSVTVNTTFSNPGHFVCWLIGHRHGDHIGFIPNYKQLVIALANGGMTVTATYSDMPRYSGTKTEDCINLYCFDLDAKTIGITRIGADVTYAGVDRKHTLISYSPS